MPASSAKSTHALTDFLDLLTLLSDEGLNAVVIGGCAVGAYAQLMGETILTSDLDLYAERATLEQIARSVKRRGATIRKVPKPRTVPVLVFDYGDKEVNVITASAGLHDPKTEARLARTFQFANRPGLAVLLGDPFDLLANKLAVNREKDRPHIPVLLRFLAEEVIHAFAEESGPRQRIDPARRLLDVLRVKTLPLEVAKRMVPLARTPVDFRFLMNHVPSRELAQTLFDHAPEELLAELATIRQRRRFPTP